MTNVEILGREIAKAARRNLLYILGGTALSGIALFAIASSKTKGE